MSCCISPNWEGQAAWTRKWEWDESQDAGRVRHSEHPQSEAGQKTRGFLFSFQADVLFFSRGCARKQPFNRRKQLQHGRSVVSEVDGFPCLAFALPGSAFFSRVRAHQRVRADTIQEGGWGGGGEQTEGGWGRQAVSERGHR